MKTSSSSFPRSLCLLLAAAAVGTLTTGFLGSKKQDTEKLSNLWQHGEINSAAAEASKLAEKNATGKDAILSWLEEATVLRAAGKFEDSNKAFESAAARIDDFAAKAKVRVSNEAVSAVASSASLPYEGRSYDAIMLETYRALNYLALGQAEQARPALIRAYQRQQDAVQDNKRRIAHAQEEAAQAKDQEKEAVTKAKDDPKFKGQVDKLTTDLSDLKAYGDYVNPFAVYLDALYFTYQAADASDLERAHKSLERCLSFAAHNDYLKQDLTNLDGLIAGQPVAATTYVIFETGCAPGREQSPVEIPLFTGGGHSFTAASFPKLVLQHDYAPSLTVAASGTNFTTAPVASMDSVIGQDFKNELPIVISKTMGPAIGKSIGLYVGNEAAARVNPFLGFAAGALTKVVSKEMNSADVRTWTTLPKEFQVARLATPADRKLEFSTASGVKTSVTVASGMVNLIYVKAITASTPLLVNQIKLK